MGSDSNKTSVDDITVEVYDTTHQLLKNYFANQTISDILPSSITMMTDTELYHKSLVHTDDINITTRVHVAQCKIYGIRTKKDEAQGFRELYELRQYPDAYYPLACYYDDHNDKKAFEYFEKCQNSLGKYRMSIILFKQYKPQQGLHYMSLSAEEGNKYAQYVLAVFYHHGILVKQSNESAKMWYERSAYQGFAEAQTALANLLIHQIDVTKDQIIAKENQALLDVALYWLSKAKSQVI